MRTILLISLWLAAPPAHAADKVAICHIPPGNPSAAHRIEVGAPAVKAHLKHGDCKDFTEDGDTCRCKEKEKEPPKPDEPKPKPT